MARLTLEIPDDTHRKLKTLAAYFGMSMKDFLITRALDPATKTTTGVDTEALNRIDEMLFSESTTLKLSPEAWDAFCQALDAPANPNPRLTKLLNTSGLLDG